MVLLNPAVYLDRLETFLTQISTLTQEVMEASYSHYISRKKKCALQQMQIFVLNRIFFITKSVFGNSLIWHEMILYHKFQSTSTCSFPNASGRNLTSFTFSERRRNIRCILCIFLQFLLALRIFFFFCETSLRKSLTCDYIMCTDKIREKFQGHLIHLQQHSSGKNFRKHGRWSLPSTQLLSIISLYFGISELRQSQHLSRGLLPLSLS